MHCEVVVSGHVSGCGGALLQRCTCASPFPVPWPSPWCRQNSAQTLLHVRMLTMRRACPRGAAVVTPAVTPRRQPQTAPLMPRHRRSPCARSPLVPPGSSAGRADSLLHAGSGLQVGGVSRSPSPGGPTTPACCVRAMPAARRDPAPHDQTWSQRRAAENVDALLPTHCRCVKWAWRTPST